jgi:hypothetical protein
VQVTLFIGRFKSPIVQINRQWIKGTDQPVISKAGV